MIHLLFTLTFFISAFGSFLLFSYIEEKIIWISKSKVYLIDLIKRYADREIEEAFILQKKKIEEKESKSLTEDERKALKDFREMNVDLNKVKAVFFLEVHNRLGIKKTSRILFNPFVKDTSGIVKNKNLLNVITKD